MPGEVQEVPIKIKADMEAEEASEEPRHEKKAYYTDILKEMENRQSGQGLDDSDSRPVNPNVPDPKSIGKVEVSEEDREKYAQRNAAIEAQRRLEEAKRNQAQARKLSSRMRRFAGRARSVFMRSAVVLSSMFGR